MALVLRSGSRVWSLLSTKRLCSSTKEVHPELLKMIVCPLSKEKLRYDKEANKLVCDSLGVAYSIVDGIPNLMPQDAWLLKDGSTITSNTD